MVVISSKGSSMGFQFEKQNKKTLGQIKTNILFKPVVLNIHLSIIDRERKHEQQKKTNGRKEIGQSYSRMFIEEKAEIIMERIKNVKINRLKKIQTIINIDKDDRQSCCLK